MKYQEKKIEGKKIKQIIEFQMKAFIFFWRVIMKHNTNLIEFHFYTSLKSFWAKQWPFAEECVKFTSVEKMIIGSGRTLSHFYLPHSVLTPPLFLVELGK